MANVAVTPTVRSEGLTELLGDILLQCTGGNPTAAGVQIPQTNLTVTLNTQVTSRLLGTNGASDALLLIDEPAATSTPSNPNPAPELICSSIYGCPVAGTGGLTNPYNGTSNPNMFQGTVAGNQVTFIGIPIDPPNTAGTRIFRITNLRANASIVPPGATGPGQILATVSASPTVPIVNPQVAVGYVEQSLSTTVSGKTFQQCPANFGNQLFTPGGSVAGGTLNVTFQENFAGAWARRTIGQDNSNPNSTGPPTVTGSSQVTTESGFLPGTAAHANSLTGLADFGTPFQITIQNVNGLTVTVPTLNPLLVSSSIAGYAQAFGGTINGTLSTFTPAAGATTLTINFRVIDTLDQSTPVKSLTVPVTLNGTAATLPANIPVFGGYLNTAIPAPYLIAPGRSNTSNIPSFYTGPAAGSSFIGASIVPCNGSPTLGAASPGSITFTGPASGSAPRSVTFAGRAAAPASVPIPSPVNFGVVSAGTAVAGVTVKKDPAATWLNVTLNQTTTPVTAQISVNPQSAAANLSTNLTFSSSSLPGQMVSLPVSYQVTAGPWFYRYGFDNVASYTSGVVAPGEGFVLFGGNDFGPSPIQLLTLDSNNRVSNMLGGVQVTFDGQAVPLYYAFDNTGIGEGQVAGFAPFELDGKAQTTVQVTYNGQTSPSVTIPVVSAVPGLLTADASGFGQVSAFNQDGSINTSSNPEAIGNIVQLFGVGAGQTTPGGRDGAFAGVGGPIGMFTNQPIRVFFDGIEATNIPYAQPAPTLVEGVIQVNAVIPPGVHHPGNVPIMIQVGDKISPPGPTVSVK